MIETTTLTAYERLLRLFAICCTVAVGAALYLATPLGLGQSPDSVGYLKGAQGIVRGLGFDYVSNHWPPLYPVVIAAIGWLNGGDVIWAARVVNAVVVAGIFAFAWKARDPDRPFDIWIVLLAVLLFVHPVSTHVNFYAWSEPLFVALLLANLFCLKRLLEIIRVEGSVTLWAQLGLGIACSLAILCRYAGVSVMACNFVAVLALTSRIPLAKRLAIAVGQFVIPLLFLSPWLIYSSMRSESLTRRVLAFHPPSYEKFANGIAVVGRWIIPGFIPPNMILDVLLGLLLIAYVGLLAGRAFMRAYRAEAISLSSVMAVFVCCYIPFILLSVTFFDVATPLDDRIFFPVFVLVLMILGNVLGYRHSNHWSRVLGRMILLLLIVSSAMVLKPWLLLNMFGGVELSSRSYETRPILSVLRNCSPNIALISDTPWEFDLYLDSKVQWLPRRYDMTSGLPNPDYVDQIKALPLKYQAIIVTKFPTDYTAEIDGLESFRRVYAGSDGVMWVNNNLNEPVCRNK